MNNKHDNTHIHTQLNYRKHQQKSHNSKHTYKHIIITKTRVIPIFYQKTYKTYDSIGASGRDMQRGTTLFFEMNISNLKGSLGKGNKRQKIHTFLSFKIRFAAKELLQSHIKHKNFNTKLDGKSSLFQRDRLTFVFLIFFCELFKCEEIWFTYCF